MAICKMCHKPIRDGLDFCEECEIKRMNQADESYLDSLLSSVSADLNNYSKTVSKSLNEHIASINPARMSSSEIKKDENVPVRIEEDIVSEEIPTSEDIIPEDVISEDTVIQEETVIPEDIIIPEDFVSQESDIITEEETILDEPDIIDEDIITDDVSLSEESLISDDISSSDEIIVSDDIPSSEDSTVSDEIIFSDEYDSNDSIAEENSDILPIDFDEIPAESDESSSESDETADEPENLLSEPDNLLSESDAVTPESDEDVDELLDSLLADMDAAKSDNIPEEPVDPIDPSELSDIFAAAEEDHNSADTDFEELPEEMQEPVSEIEEIDFSSSSIDSAKPDISVDMVDISDNIEASDNSTGQNKDDSLEPITFLSEEDLENLNNADEEPVIPIGDFDVDQVMKDIDSGNFDEQIEKLEKSGKKKKSKDESEKTKQNLFQKLFGNVYEDITPEEREKREAKEKAEAEKKIQQAELKKKQKEESKEEKEARKAAEKVAKEEAAKKAAEIKKQKAAEAAEKKRKKKEEKLAIAEIPVDEGRINRAGATILFVIFAIFTVFIIVGTNIYSYNLSIKNASDEFEIKHYNDAYYEVYGLKIQEEDIELYDKIMTVMYVNTQLNSYEYYMTSNNREKALDSLLKGLQRYDKYLELAITLDIEDDLNYVKNIILEKLDETFRISEEEANSMIEIRDEIDYSEYIFSLLGTYEVDIVE